MVSGDGGMDGGMVVWWGWYGGYGGYGGDGGMVGKVVWMVIGGMVGMVRRVWLRGFWDSMGIVCTSSQW